MLGNPGAARIDVSTTLDENQRITNIPHSEEGLYNGPYSLSLDTSLGDLLKAPNCETLNFDVIDENGTKQGQAHFPFRNAFSMEHEVRIPFSVEITYSVVVRGEEEPENVGHIGNLEGSIFYLNLPVYAQMVGGVCIDGEIDGGHWLFLGLPYPNVMTEAPALWQDPSERDRFADLQPDEDHEPNLDDLDDETFFAALDQVEVPPPWEKRGGRASDRSGNRMYFVDPRSRRTTYKDPRFVPQNWDQRIDPATGKVYFHYHKVRGSTYIDPRGCPKDWEMRLSKDGDVYFAFVPAMRTTWADPRGIPDNLEACLDDRGRIYFKDHLAKTTCWEDPRQDQQEVMLSQWRTEEMSRWLKAEVFSELESMKQRVDEDDGDEDESGRR